ncbi:MAG: FeoA family protein [Candidatus Humimicrobiaceae bacterium]
MNRKQNKSMDLKQTENNLISLVNAEISRNYKIEKMHGGSVFNMRLLSLGFIPGEAITVINKFGNGPITVNVKGNKIGLGRGAAARILVSEVK